jgi:hypothetical protein
MCWIKRIVCEAGQDPSCQRSLNKKDLKGHGQITSTEVRISPLGCNKTADQ